MNAQRTTAGVDIAAIAADEYRQRCAKARELVAAGRMTTSRAESEMRAWAAIAVLAGAPMLEAEIADYRRTIVHYPGGSTRALYGHLLPEDEARCDLARDLCGPNIWGPVLMRARDTALAKADTPERRRRAAGLNILARALDVPLTPASCVIASLPERKAA